MKDSNQNQLILQYQNRTNTHMTSFQRFRRDVRARSNSGIKSQIKKVNSRNDSKVHDFVNFSASQILFELDPKVPYCVFKLKITNLTGFRIHFKIRCNNSKCYTVTPYQQVISNNQEMEIKFQFLPKLFQPTANFNDRFQILWGKIPVQPLQPTTLTQSKIFPVTIKQVQFDGKQDVFNDFQFQKKLQQNQGRINENNFDYKDKNIVSSPIVNGVNQYHQSSMDLKQQKIIQAILQGNVKYKSLLTKTNIVLVCAVSFILGFLFS